LESIHPGELVSKFNPVTKYDHFFRYLRFTFPSEDRHINSNRQTTKTQKTAESIMTEYLITFAAGASYGLTTVLVGQPLDTIKVRMQGLPPSNNSSSNAAKSSPSSSSSSAYRVATELFAREGVAGLYRGGLPLFLGGSLMRSAQFGVSGSTKTWLEQVSGGKTAKSNLIFGILDWQVIVAGIAGGLARGLVEVPTDYFKTRRQVERSWTLDKSILDGTAVTMFRNTILYASFMVYIDFSKLACQAGYVPTMLMTEDQQGLVPFAKGSICANLAWLTVWPADVIKTQRQSGNYVSQSTLQLLQQNIQSGRLFRGIVPGLVRSSISNGSSMVVYEFVHSSLTNHLQLERRDMT
jgi:solute carrier family 25 (mitochondrial carnitine/acylcarnitine transporter), member 20/29